jgi:excisionase family DNA binding protein
VNLDDRLAQLVRDALEPMLAERLDHLEERLVERLTDVVRDAAAPASAPPTLLTLKEVARYLQVSPRTVERMVVAGEFPPPMSISPGRSRWRQSNVDAWIETRGRRR